MGFDLAVAATVDAEFDSIDEFDRIIFGEFDECADEFGDVVELLHRRGALTAALVA